MIYTAMVVVLKACSILSNSLNIKLQVTLIITVIPTHVNAYILTGIRTTLPIVGRTIMASPIPMRMAGIKSKSLSSKNRAHKGSAKSRIIEPVSTVFLQDLLARIIIETTKAINEMFREKP